MTGYCKTGPCGSFESRTATIPISVATSAQFPLFILRLALRQSRCSRPSCEGSISSPFTTLARQAVACRAKSPVNKLAESNSNLGNTSGGTRRAVVLRTDFRQQFDCFLWTQCEIAQVFKDLHVSGHFVFALDV
jgi:hypothetical protein